MKVVRIIHASSEMPSVTLHGAMNEWTKLATLMNLNIDDLYTMLQETHNMIQLPLTSELIKALKHFDVSESDLADLQEVFDGE